MTIKVYLRVLYIYLKLITYILDFKKRLPEEIELVCIF